MSTAAHTGGGGTRPHSQVSRGPAQADAVVARDALSSRTLAIALGLSLWIAAGSLFLAVAEGLGSHPLRRLLIGITFVVLMSGALWQRDRVCAALRARPWLVIVAALAELALVVADGVIPRGPYGVITVTALGIAAVVADPRLVWLCVAALDGGYAIAVLAELSPADVVSDAHLANVLGAMLGYPFAALVVLGLASGFKRFMANCDAHFEIVHGPHPGLPPALASAVRLGAGHSARQLHPPSALAALSRAEIRVVEALAGGRRPKQIAFASGRSIATVRKHIQNAKRKTGAGTLPELAAMTTRPDWPGASDDAHG